MFDVWLVFSPCWMIHSISLGSSHGNREWVSLREERVRMEWERGWGTWPCIGSKMCNLSFQNQILWEKDGSPHPWWQQGGSAAPAESRSSQPPCPPCLLKPHLEISLELTVQGRFPSGLRCQSVKRTDGNIQWFTFKPPVFKGSHFFFKHDCAQIRVHINYI